MLLIGGWPLHGERNALDREKRQGVFGHEHTRGKSVTLLAGNQCLLNIPRWDFQWQQSYFRPAPYVLPNGQSVKMTCTWDNPTSATIRWGENTANEMCFAYLYATL